MNFYLQISTSLLNILAPDVSLKSNSSTKGGFVTVTEGSGVSFNCECDDVTPPGDQTVFTFNEERTIMSKVV